jgi:hypothetical protein
MRKGVTMFLASGVRKGAEEEGFSLARKNTRIGPKVVAPHLEQGTALPPEINLSGSELLVGFASAICLTGLVLWALLKLWLFE